MTEPSRAPRSPLPYPSDIPDMAVLPVRRPCFDRVHCIALVLLISGAVSLGIEGVFAMDPIAELLGAHSALSRAVRVVIGLAGLYVVHLVVLFRPASRIR